MSWGLPLRQGSKVLCSDGKIRSLVRLAITHDTFFSIPCAVKVKGKTIAGYATGSEQAYKKGFKEKEPFLTATTFQPYLYRKNHALLPAWPDKFDDTEKWNALIEQAQ